MKDIERSSDNKYCRELTITNIKRNKNSKWYSLIYIKDTNKLECYINNSCDKFPINRVIPTIPIIDLLWLVNGDTEEATE
jgi:predicted alpha/beta superfamily hydrolase